jgi:tetratricopeptide (TPR) repeat protein
LLAEFEAKVAPADRQAAAAVVREAAAKGQPEAEGYDLFAGGEMLKGNFTTAAWGALKAAGLAWKASFVANAAVYLSHLDRLDDADALLSCAGELDPRSPFVIEAQAMLALRRNDCDRAKERIALAVRLLPGDMNVRYSAGVIHHKCGDRAAALRYLRDAELLMPDDEVVKEAIKVVDPASASRPRQPDALDRLVEECLAFLDEMEARGGITSDYYQAASREIWGPAHTPEDFARDLRQHAQDSRQEIARYVREARDERGGAPDPFAWNQVVYACVDAYTDAIYEYQRLYASPGRAVVLSAALGMDLVAYSSRCKGQRDLEFVFLDEDKRFEEGIRPAAERLNACLNRGGTDAQRDACYRAFCDDALPVLKKYIANATANMAAAEAGFPGAAEDYANLILSYVDRGADYTARALKAMKPTPANADLGAQVARNIADLSKLRLDGSVEFTVARLSESHQTLRSALEYGPQELRAAADDDPERGKFRLCPQTRPDPVPVDPPIDPFLDALRAATTVEAGPNVFDCEVKAGAFSVQVKSSGGRDLSVKLSEKVGDVSYGASVGTGGRVGGEVSYSQSASSHGVAVKGSVKLWGEARRGGAVNYGAQVEGKMGVGVTYKGQGLACYLVSGKATFNARVFAARLSG